MNTWVDPCHPAESAFGRAEPGQPFRTLNWFARPRLRAAIHPLGQLGRVWYLSVAQTGNVGQRAHPPNTRDEISMKRTFQCALAGTILLASSSVWAQDFGQKGQVAISAERLFGIAYDHSSTTQNGLDTTYKTTTISLLSSPVVGGNPWLGYGSPRVAGDYFIIDHLSLGAALGYQHWSTTRQAPVVPENNQSGDGFTFAPRVGYTFAFTDKIGIWPRAGFTYRTFSAQNTSAHDLAFTLEAPFTFNLIPHVVFWGGPTLDLGLSGSSSVQNPNNGATTSIDFNATEIGIQTALLIYFGT